ncbi:serine/threonine-protein kinase [Chondromyces apiculatus]|uniref:Serine/threonine protein kinase n=1 Tax=Chondromyces apiculatus DSM 436 TaxID=1192034 RepID=A0A017SXM2_9BACT|nr:protein kinase [Chondromyces apiculatus]EYF01502.1 Serine/threonine protein kinase [Chondromyces apiculatus DSM 436]
MEPGTLIAGRFAIERQAAAGGMGTVFRAGDLLDGSTVALKILRGQDALDVDRFEREARILSELDHPSIVHFVAHGTTTAGERYLAMEWLEGEDLAARLARRAVTPLESLSLLRKAAEALGYAHNNGIVHRDIKPSNLFLVAGDVRRLKIVDFGIARPDGDTQRLTYTGGILGTPGYIAPEQLEGQPAREPPADVFSLGCVLYECIAGRPAFEGAHLMAALAKLLFQEPPRVRELRPDIPEPLERLIERMMAKTPADRPRDGNEVCAALDAIEGALAAWAMPNDRGTLASAPLPPASGRVPDSLTIREARLVSLVLAGDPDAGSARGIDPGALDAADVREAVSSCGAHLVELVRGSLVAVVSGPGSAVDRAERAVQCALILRERFRHIPVCVVTGRGVSSAKLIEGDVIDRGVRALRSTLGGAVRVDDVTAGMLGARFEVSSESGGLYISGEGSSDEGLPLLLGRPSPWVGRSRELAALEGVFSGCVQESLASAVLVTGPAGAGKSRLRQEFVTRSRRISDPLEILIGRASSVAAGSPFGIVADAIRRAAGIRDGESLELRRRKLKARLGRHLEGQPLATVTAFLGEVVGTPFPEGEARGLRAARENAMLMSDATRAAWEDWLAAECASQPVLMVLEDLHWGDAATVRLIDATLRNLHDLPLMLLVLARPEIHQQFPSLWVDREVQVIKLGPLPARASEKLVRGVLGEQTAPEVVARLVDRADGNPFYLEELIRAVAAGKEDGLPDSVLGTVEARLDAEGTEAKRALRAASVFGDRFSKQGVAALLGGDNKNREVESVLQALAARELIASINTPGPVANEYVFRHAIVREAAYAMLTDNDRELGHRLAGEWLERTGYTDAMTMAEHFRRGGVPERSVRWYKRAAEQALEANDLGATLERANRAIECGAEGHELGSIRLIEAEANLWRGELAIAEQRANEATDLLPPLSAAWFRAGMQAANAAGRLGATERVARWASIASVVTGGDNARRAQMVCLSNCATYLTFGGRYAEADALITRLHQATAEQGHLDPEVAAELHQMRAFRASAAGDPGACLREFQASLAAFDLAGDQRNACNIRSNLGFIYTELGDFEHAEETFRSALTTASRMGLDDLETAVLHNLGKALAYRGNLEEARLLEQRAVDAFQQQGAARLEGASRVYLAEIALLSGDLTAAEREARAAADTLKVAPALRASAVALLSRALLAQGRADEALTFAREAHAELQTLGSLEEGEAMVRLAYAEALDANGEAVNAAEVLAAAREHLLSRAAKISDLRWRDRFLSQVPDNARTLSLASARIAPF